MRSNFDCWWLCCRFIVCIVFGLYVCVRSILSLGKQNQRCPKPPPPGVLMITSSPALTTRSTLPPRFSEVPLRWTRMLRPLAPGRPPPARKAHRPAALTGWRPSAAPGSGPPGLRRSPFTQCLANAPGNLPVSQAHLSPHLFCGS